MPKGRPAGSLSGQLSSVFEDFSHKVGLYEGSENIWEHKPVDVVQFIEDPRFMNSKFNPSTGIGCFPCVMDDMVSLFGTDPYEVAPIKREAYFSEAIGTGKSTKLAWICLYGSYKLLCLRNPIAWFQMHGGKLLANTKLSIVMLSRTEDNAKEVVFQKANMFVLQSDWFNEFYLPVPDIMSKIVFDAPPKNRKQHKMGKLYKNISIVPGSSSEFSPLGKDLFIAIIDEVTKFQAAQDRGITDGNTDQAEILFNAVKSRVTSRVTDNGLVCCVGNPEHTQDFLERHTEKEAKNPLVHIVKRRSIWSAKQPEFDPNLIGKDGLPIYSHFFFDVVKRRIIPEEIYIRKKARDNTSGILRIPYGPSNQYFEVFRDRPEIALRDYAGIPTEAVGAWWDEPDLLNVRVNKNRTNPIDEKILTPDNPEKHIADWFIRKDLKWHGLHIDLAEVGDSATFALSHPVELDKKKNPKIYLDLIYRYLPNPSNPFQIHLIQDFVDYLWKVKRIPIGLITADQHQSTQLLQTFEAWGLNTEVLSVDKNSKEIMDNLRWAIKEKRLDFFKHGMLMREILGLEKNGQRVEKSRYGTDDVVQAVAGSVWNSMKLALLDDPLQDEWTLENEEIPGETGGSSAEIF